MINDPLNLPFHNLNLLFSGNSEKLDLQFRYTKIDAEKKKLDNFNKKYYEQT